jgi:long-chain fatty acid transport protein
MDGVAEVQGSMTCPCWIQDAHFRSPSRARGGESPVKKINLGGAVRGATLAMLGLSGATAYGAGFAIIEHGAQGMGNAFAGGGAVAEDASTVWFNPASMTRLPSQVQTAGHVIVASFEFSGSGTAATGAPILGSASEDGGTVGLVPNLYVIRSLTDDVTFGLGINAPFGLATEYDRGWVGRYQAVDSAILTINVNPALAWKLNDYLSLGAGLNVQYFKAELSSAIDFRSACLGQAQTAQAGAAAAAGAGNAALAAQLAAQAAALAGACTGPANTALDGFAENKAHSVGFGFNVGAMLELSENTRLSAAFRSSIEHDLDGDVSYQLPNNPTILAAFGPLFPNDGVSAAVDLPASLEVSGYHRFANSRFAVMGSAMWTQWSKIPNLTIVNDTAIPGRSQQSVEDLDWEDAWRFGLGLNYYHDDHLTLRTGAAYDQSPAGGATFTTARLPDADRIWVSIGASYAFSDALKADFGYSHLFVDDSSIRRLGSQSDTLNGSYESDADIFSVQVNYKF